LHRFLRRSFLVSQAYNRCIYPLFFLSCLWEIKSNLVWMICSHSAQQSERQAITIRGQSSVLFSLPLVQACYPLFTLTQLSWDRLCTNSFLASVVVVECKLWAIFNLIPSQPIVTSCLNEIIDKAEELISTLNLLAPDCCHPKRTPPWTCRIRNLPRGLWTNIRKIALLKFCQPWFWWWP
jgi:hypothetical protein